MVLDGFEFDVIISLISLVDKLVDRAFRVSVREVNSKNWWG